jgi:DNA-damage-inducible protein J
MHKGDHIMAANALVQTRINGKVKAEASAVLATMGLTVSDAVRIMLTRVAHDKALPFEPFRPNAETIAAMEEARRGENMESFDSIQALMADLNADD